MKTKAVNASVLARACSYASILELVLHPYRHIGIAVVVSEVFNVILRQTTTDGLNRHCVDERKEAAAECFSKKDLRL